MPDGGASGQPEVVPIMTAEDGIADTVRPRLEAAGADLERVEVFTEVQMVDGATRLPSIPMDLSHVEALVTRSGVALVVIDVLNAYLSSKVDGYRDQDVRGALHPLAKMAERTGATVVCLRHLSKTGGANAIYRGGGSIGIIGGARAGLLVAPDPDDESRRVLAVSKSNLAEKPPSLAYRLVNDRLHDVARVQWEGAVEHTADGLLVTRGEEHRSDDELDAVGVLTDILMGGPLWVAEAIKAMATAGFSKDQAKRAKSKAGAARSRWAPQETPSRAGSGCCPPEGSTKGAKGVGFLNVLPSLPWGVSRSLRRTPGTGSWRSLSSVTWPSTRLEPVASAVRPRWAPTTRVPSAPLASAIGGGHERQGSVLSGGCGADQHPDHRC